jgi:hypothetical protein
LTSYLSKASNSQEKLLYCTIVHHLDLDLDSLLTLYYSSNNYRRSSPQRPRKSPPIVLLIYHQRQPRFVPGSAQTINPPLFQDDSNNCLPVWWVVGTSCHGLVDKTIAMTTVRSVLDEFLLVGWGHKSGKIKSRDRLALSESDQQTDRVASTTSINQLAIMRERMQQPSQGCCWLAHSVPIFGHWPDSKIRNLRAQYSFVGPFLAVGTVW